MTIRKTLAGISRSQVADHLKVAKVAALGIKVVSAPADWDQFSYRKQGRLRHLPINCFAYALRLDRSALYRSALMDGVLAGYIPHYASTDFMRWFLSSRRPRQPPTAGNLVVYFIGTSPIHAGIVIGPGVVRSKWGMFRPIFEHRVWHVPSTYGPTVKFFSPVSLARAELSFGRFFRLPGY
jgi:hypothetical protein